MWWITGGSSENFQAIVLLHIFVLLWTSFKYWKKWKVYSINTNIALLKKHLCQKSFEIFLYTSRRKIKLLFTLDWIATGICLFIPALATVVLFNLYKQMIFAWLSAIVAILLFGSLFNWIVLTIRFRRNFDKLFVKIQQINPEISFLKGYHFCASVPLKSQRFTYAAGFFAKNPELNLTKNSLRRNTLNQINELMTFFGKLMKLSGDDPNNFSNQVFVFKSSNSILNPQEMLEKFNSVLSKCKIEVKVLHPASISSQLKCD